MATLDWDPFKKAYTAGLPNAGLLARLELVTGWVALPVEAARAALKAEWTSAPKELFQALNIVSFKLQHALGVSPGPEAQAKLQELFATVTQGGGSPEQRRLVEQLWTSWHLLGDLLKVDPTLNQGTSPAELAKAELQRAAGKIFDRFSRVPIATRGSASTDSVQQLESVISEYHELIARTSTDNTGLPDVYYGLGHVELSLVKSLIILGRNDEASIHFQKCADGFSRAGHPEKSATVLAELATFERNRSGQLDEAAAQSLRAVTSQLKQPDPSDRISSYIELATVAANAADVFEARRNAEVAATEIEKLGLSDPSRVGAEDAMQVWIDQASRDLGGVALLARIQLIGHWYRQIFNARYADLIRADATQAERLNGVQQQMDGFLAEASRVAERAAVERSRLMNEYFPTLVTSSPEVDPNGQLTQDQLTARMRAVDTALAAIRTRCNDRIGKGDSFADLLGELEEIENQADSLKVPLYEARARLERIYVLGHAGRPAEILPLAREARRRLLSGRPPTLSAFNEAFDRLTYIETYRAEANAFIMLQDSGNLLATCAEVIRDFETFRYNIANPYRTNSVLSTVADFYKWSAVAAFKLERWETMLETIELVKARSAIQTRLRREAPDLPGEASLAPLRDEFSQLGSEIGKGTLGPEAVARRRQLWDLLSIARHAGKAAAPEFSLQRIQAALSQEEALLGYFWLSDEVLLVIAIDHERSLSTRVSLSPDELNLYQNFTTFVRQLKSAAGRGFDNAINRLGQVFLPPTLREFVRGKDRLIISPHHALHLFPFQAVRWDDRDYLGTHFALRYVPNFTSLLMPWEKRYEDLFYGVAIKEFSHPSIPLLDRVEDDLDEIEALYRAKGRSTSLLKGPSATRERLTSPDERAKLQAARWIHLGTHGLSVFESPNEPMDAQLLLQDGALDCMDIAELRLTAELAVVSACDSGQRSTSLRDFAELPGDDIFGLQAALFQAGVRCVLGSLWLVETESSSAIIKSFHRHMASIGEADLALRLALREYLANPASQLGAFYWAPYFLSCLGAPALADTDRGQGALR